MSPRAHFYLAALILTCVFTPFGASILTEKQQVSAYKLENYREALAQITEASELRRRKSGGSTIYVSYNFRTPSGEAFSGKDTIPHDEWKQNRGEKPIRVYYNPNAPYINTLARSVDDFADERPLALRLSVGALIGAPLAVIVAGIWAWLVSRRRRRRQN